MPMLSTSRLAKREADRAERLWGKNKHGMTGYDRIKEGHGGCPGRQRIRPYIQYYTSIN
jgi:hypothetical protein